MKKSILIFTLLLWSLANTSYGQTNLQLKKTIDSLYEIDQNVQWNIQKGYENNVSFDSMQKLNVIRKQTFDKDIPIIKEIYAKYGYPTIKMVGKETSSNYFILIQHADSDPAFQSIMLPILKKLSNKGKVSKKDYAMLYDRVQRNTGKKQLYGTQLSFDGTGNLFNSKNEIILPKDLEDPKNVDKRRKKMGLEPLEKYYEATLEALGRPRKK